MSSHTLFDKRPSKNKDTCKSDDDKASSYHISLLEHLNFNVPNHDYILDFYLGILGCGLDPKVAVNLMDDNDESFGREGLIWASCGPNQFHFPRDVKAQGQFLSGHIGLRYRSLDGLKKRLIEASNSGGTDDDDDSSSLVLLGGGGTRNGTECFESFEIVAGPDTDETIIRIKDRYGNTFHCREGSEKLTQYSQSVVKFSDRDKFGDVALRYGVAEESDCRGIDHVEFFCRVGTADKIASFYESVFDAIVFVREDDDHKNMDRKMAYISIGDIDPTTGQASQYLIFRETQSEIPPYDGHHIAIYIGPHDTKEFERAFHKAEKAGLLSTNWRDAVDVLTWDAARLENQFRIEKIVDGETGETIFQLEHEVRSVKHPRWPGAK